MSVDSLTALIVDPAIREAINTIRHNLGQGDISDDDFNNMTKPLFEKLIGALIEAQGIKMLGPIIRQIMANVQKINDLTSYSAQPDFVTLYNELNS